MMNHVTPHLKINGVGSAAGGNFDEVVIKGKGVIYDDVFCKTFHSIGKSKVDGNIETEHWMKAKGDTVFNGHLKADQLKIVGQSEINKYSSFNELNMSGEASFHEGLSSKEISIEGEMFVNGNCYADAFLSNGNTKIDGILSSNHVQLKLCGKTNIYKIVGKKISVMRNVPILSNYQKVTALIAKAILGDFIYLENTTAHLVQGDHVKIGPNCKIDRLEYRTALHQTTHTTIHHHRMIS